MNFLVGLIYYILFYVFLFSLIIGILFLFEYYPLYIISFLVIIVILWVIVISEKEIKRKGENIIRFLKGE